MCSSRLSMMGFHALFITYGSKVFKLLVKAQNVTKGEYTLVEVSIIKNYVYDCDKLTTTCLCYLGKHDKNIVDHFCVTPTKKAQRYLQHETTKGAANKLD